MKLQVKEQVKTLLAQKGIKHKQLAQILSEKTGRKYTPSNLSHRLTSGTVTYNEMLVIAEILKYEIKFVDMET